MATIYIDNKPYDVNPEENLLHACLSLGFNLPYFCWHPAMGSVGACRQCAVKQFKDEHDTKGKIIMACMTPVADGMRISIDDPEAKAFRGSVIEWLMLNHPHDCPVCDEGGECHLQDMTVMVGHDYRRTRFKKRTHRNQNLGPFVLHEMNRCIQCYRCVRFYRDYAGGRDFNVFGIHDGVYFGRSESGTLENVFSGNLVEVCPTGVFTDKTLARHYTRKWDLEDAPSVCVHCGLGCNTSPRARYGLLRRIVNRFNFDINGYFICDRGRFGYEFVNSPRRIRKVRIMQRRLEESESARSAVEEVRSLLDGCERVIGIGSPRASLEANFALRALVGVENFASGLSAGEARMVASILDILRRSAAPAASVHDIEESDAVLVLGEDLLNTAPRLELAVRQAVRWQPIKAAEKLKIPRWNDYAMRTAIQESRGPLIVATPFRTSLDEIASDILHAAPGNLARFGFALAHALDPEAPAVDGDGAAGDLVRRAAEALSSASRPAIISGANCGSVELLEAAASVARALGGSGGRAKLCYTVPECNSLGAGLLSRASLDDLLQTPGRINGAIVLENDLYRRAPRPRVDGLLKGAKVVALDVLENDTTAQAGVVLPSGSFAESEGTLVNNEGRAQRFFKTMQPGSPVRESWRWLRDIMVASGRLAPEAWQSLDEVIAAIASEFPELRLIAEAAPPASFRMVGQKIPRESHRYSGRTAVFADVTVHEPAPPDDPDSPLAFSMEGYQGRPPAGLASLFWAPGWNSVQAVARYQKDVGGPLVGGPAGALLFNRDGGGGGDHDRYSQAIPASFVRREGAFLILRAARVFGSDELSVEALGIAERLAPPTLDLNPFDVAALKVSAGSEVELVIHTIDTIDTIDTIETIEATTVRVQAALNPSIPLGTAALSAGLPGLPGIDLPRWGKISIAG